MEQSHWINVTMGMCHNGGNIVFAAINEGNVMTKYQCNFYRFVCTKIIPFYSRTKILGAAVMAFSISTLCVSLAEAYWQLVLLRMLLAVGLRLIR